MTQAFAHQQTHQSQLPRVFRLRPSVYAVAAMTLSAICALAAQPLNASVISDTAYWDSAWAEYLALDAVPLAVSGYARETATLSITINAPRETVFDIYSNVYNALGIHPYLSAMVPIRCYADTFDFTAVEVVPVDNLELSLRTVAQQRFRRPAFYTSNTLDRPGVMTHQAVSFVAQADGATVVTEYLTFEAPPLLIGETVDGGVYAHSLVQQGLKAKIEAGELQPIPYPNYLPISCGDHP